MSQGAPGVPGTSGWAVVRGSDLCPARGTVLASPALGGVRCASGFLISLYSHSSQICVVPLLQACNEGVHKWREAPSGNQLLGEGCKAAGARGAGSGGQEWWPSL